MRWAPSYVARTWSGQVAVAQALLPNLRAARGRIVNVGSIAGRSAAAAAGRRGEPADKVAQVIEDALI